jgi:hypothetical protein
VHRGGGVWIVGQREGELKMGWDGLCWSVRYLLLEPGCGRGGDGIAMGAEAFRRPAGG